MVVDGLSESLWFGVDGMRRKAVCDLERGTGYTTGWATNRRVHAALHSEGRHPEKLGSAVTGDDELEDACWSV
jgi:hypothetical protein